MPPQHPPDKRRAAMALVQQQRRQLVARMRLRHVTVRDIQAALAKQFPDPKTGKPWSLGCIQNDCMALKREWQALAAADTAEHQAALLAELREARREAWQDKAFDLVLRGIKLEADLLGLNAPKQIDLTVRIEALAVALGMDPKQAVADAEAFLAEQRRASTR